MDKGRIEFSITSLEPGEILNQMAMFKYFLHKLKLRIFQDNIIMEPSQPVSK